MGNKLPVIVLAATILIVVAGVFLSNKNSATPAANVPLPTNHEYFWSTTCPHCKIVGEFLEGWDKKDKLQLDKKEVGIKENAILLTQRADYCNLPREQLGVPFLFTPDGKCVTGDQPIIEYFKNLNL